MTSKNFASDNVTRVDPVIFAALASANEGNASPYGTDSLSQTLTERCSQLFETEVVVFPVATGSAANALALSVMSPPYGAIYCHQDAHIQMDECGAPEFFTGGAKLITLAGEQGKIPVERLAQTLDQSGAGIVHHVQPAVVSLTQATEAGTVYSVAEVKAIAELAHHHRLTVHMDGARFANAIVHLGCSPADVTWRAGVDVLSFGATKNGAMAAEAVVFFNPALVRDFEFRRKRGGHLFSKGRFLSAQLLAYIENDRWLTNAAHANAMAQRLASGLRSLPGVKLQNSVEANELFVEMPTAMIEGLFNDGFEFYRWGNEQSTTVRLVTAFNTSPESVDALLSTAQRCSSLMLT